ncbi:tetratricopeptide repeat protein [Gemmata sp. JC717]|uniref:tetratricopeptide repeat protein n=1 Tax=Gemmata algarum TaxID=2975278 RepID=UPI0021BAF88B|nr:tetratricopeptide repeat protein [Gemmata algarum]MDY3555674.1 tetratricopeptide repeat protein [Gemmata algarum]
MPPQPYDPCPCGSGKKFKWCCASYFDTVEKAFEQERQGQHEAALQTMQALTKARPDNPSVWGYYAQFLYNAQQPDKAEEAVDEALRLNPDSGMAHFLRGQFRENEGELLGALLLFRKAAEAYDPESHEQLAQVYFKIYQYEATVLNRPVAARAALERVIHFQPTDAELRQQFEVEFGPEGPYPAAASKKYKFRPTAKPVPEAAATGKLSDARKAFEDLTKLTPDDPAAWFNLGLVLAWLGEQPRAVAALVKSLEFETDDHRAEEAGALAEVLRCGAGMENDTDHISHTFVLRIRDAQAVMNLLRAYDQARKLRNMRADQESGMLFGLLVEELPSLLAVGAVTMAKIAARLVVSNGSIFLSHPNRESVAKAADEIYAALQLAVEQPVAGQNPLNFRDVVLEAMAQPTASGDLNAAEAKLRDHAANYFEGVWLHRPLKALSGNAPIEAVGSKVLRKHVFGVVKFLEDCLKLAAPSKQVGQEVVPIEMYNFANLRHKLNLEYVTADPPKVHVPEDKKDEPAPAPRAAAPAPAPEPKKRDIGAMNTPELAALDVAALSVGELEQAMLAAVKLKAHELAVAFAQAGLLKPFDAANPDRYRLYATAITGAAANGDTARAGELIDEGTKYDAEHNGGQRGTDYQLRKIALFVKAKDAEKAAAEYSALLAAHPDEGKFYASAAEDMLRLKNGEKALQFAEGGLEAARRTGNRDLEGHCSELVAAAQKAK